MFGGREEGRRLKGADVRYGAEQSGIHVKGFHIASYDRIGIVLFPFW